MSFCKKCGSELEAGNNSCPRCGAMQHPEFNIKKIADFCVNAYEKIVIIVSAVMVIITAIVGGFMVEPVVGIIIWLIGSLAAVLFCGAALQITYIRKSLENIEKRGN